MWLAMGPSLFAMLLLPVFGLAEDYQQQLSKYHISPANTGSIMHWPQRQLAIVRKRDPLGINERGFHEDVFNRDYGTFHPMKRRSVEHVPVDWRKLYEKRKPEMDSSGFHGDTFSSGFGDFWTMKKKSDEVVNKRKPEMDSAGFYGDTFSNGFGDFWTVKKSEKRKPEMDSAGFYGDTFSNGFGDFWTVKKRSTESTESP